jgi:hypothetical protein
VMGYVVLTAEILACGVLGWSLLRVKGCVAVTAEVLTGDD